MSSEEIVDVQQQAHYKRVCEWSCDEVVTWIRGNQPCGRVSVDLVTKRVRGAVLPGDGYQRAMPRVLDAELREHA